MYDSLEKVAPVITLNTKDIYNDWQYGIRTAAKIIGKGKGKVQCRQKKEGFL